MTVLKLSKDITIPARHTFSVRLDFFPFSALYIPLLGFRAPGISPRLGEMVKSAVDLDFVDPDFDPLKTLTATFRNMHGFFGALGRSYLRSPRW